MDDIKEQIKKHINMLEIDIDYGDLILTFQAGRVVKMQIVKNYKIEDDNTR